VDEGGQVASIIEDHVQGLASIESSKSLLNAPEIFFLSLAFPCEDRNAGCGDAATELKKKEQVISKKGLRSSSVVLRRKYVLK